MPYEQYLDRFGSRPDAIPQAVANRIVLEDMSPARAWREHLDLTPAEIAERMGVTPSAVAQYEGANKLRKATRARLAVALGIHPNQLDI